MKPILRVTIAALIVSACSTIANASTISYKEIAQFTSTLQVNNPITLTYPQFDDLGGTLTLTGVMVEFIDSGSVHLLGDNDDSTREAEVRGQMIRAWSGFGPGVFSDNFQMVNTPLVDLSFDDSDGGDNDVFDPTPLDGHDFGVLSYGPMVQGPYFPAMAPYIGLGTVDFEISADLMVNQLEFVVAPEEWQLQVADPTMDVSVRVTYTYVPEPGTVGLLAIGVLPLFRLFRGRRA